MRLAQKVVRLWLPFLLVALVGMIVGAAITYSYTATKQTNLQKKYSLVAKRSLINNPNDIILDFSSLKKQLQSYIDTNLGVNQASVYFEYLPTGTSIGFNENEELTGASLLKTPLAINLYKAVDEHKIDLNQTVELKQEFLDSKYGDLYKKGVGYKLTLKEATRIMLEDSDNTAALVIYDALNKVAPLGNNLLQFIDIDYGVNQDSTIRISTDTYTNILKCLYFSCYTSVDSSQEILTYLSKSSANNRLKLYLPDDIVVAHKVGTYDALGQQHVQSDCGIFYVPQRNYLLCIMVKGEDPNASRAIGDLSKTTYDFIKQY